MAQATQQPVGTDRESLISIVLGAIVVIIIGALAFRYFTNRNSQPTVTQEDNATTEQNVVEVQELPTEVQLEQNENGQQVPANLPASYTVQAGESTWEIAQAFYGSGFNYVDIERENGLQTEQGLTVGQKLTIPRVPVRTADQAGTDMDALTVQEGEMPATQTGGPTKGDNAQAETMME